MTDDDILDAILRREGGFVNDPVDRGRATNRGITLDTLATWRKRPVSVEDVRQMTEAEARAIYRALYLKPFEGVNPEVKPQAVDIAVNSGVGRASALLLKAAEGPRPLPVQLVVERLRFYARIVKNDPTQSKFLLGWINRAVEFL